MKKYPKELSTLIMNLIKLHIDYDNMYEQIQCSFPKLDISYEEMLDIVQELVVQMI